MSGCRVGQSHHRASVGLRLQMPLQAGGETKSGLKRHTYVLILACFCAVSSRPFSFLFFIQMESTIICLGLRWFSFTTKLTATGSQREGAMNIFVWCVRWDLKTAGNLHLPVAPSLSLPLFHLPSHSFSTRTVKYVLPKQRTIQSEAHLCFSDVCFCYVLLL